MYKKLVLMTLILSLFCISTKIVNAADCDPIEDNSNNPNRVLSCDMEKTTTTTFQYPNGVGVQPTTFENKYCKVTCKENIAFSIPSVRRVYAGMGFSYPLNVSAQRSCRGTYINYEDFDKKLRTLIDVYMVLDGIAFNGVPKTDINEDGVRNNGDLVTVNGMVSTLTDIDDKKVLDLNNDRVLDNNATLTLSNAINNMKTQKTECDDWGKVSNPSSTYSLNPTVSLRIKTSKADEIEVYEYKETSPYSSIRTDDDSTYSSCTAMESIVAGRREFVCQNNKTIIGWTEIANLYGRYSMKEKKIELYNGEVMLKDDNTLNKTCLAGEKHYVPLTEVTKPDLDDINDKGYSMILTVSNLGNNIDNTVAKSLNLTVNCWYQVRNIISPTPGDYFYEKYSTSSVTKYPLLYVYRPIDLKNPFPNREPGANWSGEITEVINDREVTTPLKDRFITSSADTIQNKSPYTINLTTQKINEIKRQNRYYNYIDFKLDDYEKSTFVENNPDIITIGDR